MGRKVLKFDSPSGAEGCGIAYGGHWVARVQKVQKVLPAFGRRVQRVVVSPAAMKFICRLSAAHTVITVTVIISIAAAAQHP